MNKNNKSIFVIKTFPEWIEYAKKLPDPEMLFDVFWFEGELCFLFSDTGAGKTTLAVQIAQSIATGKPVIDGFKMKAKAQDVLICDFEMSPKQCETKYKNKSDGKHYQLSDKIFRVELDLSEYDFKNDLQESIINEIIDVIKEQKIKILIIDNITYIQDTSDINQAIKFMQKMNMIKKQYQLSILVLGHTPKRNLFEPITKNSMSGSKKLMDLTDSSFAIGESAKGIDDRYLKQIKVRQEGFTYHYDNVLDCELKQINSFTGFHGISTSPEYTHLKKIEPKEQRNEEIFEEYKSGKITQEALGEKHNLSRKQINKIIKKTVNTKGDDLPF